MSINVYFYKKKITFILDRDKIRTSHYNKIDCSVYIIQKKNQPIYNKTIIIRLRSDFKPKTIYFI